MADPKLQKQSHTGETVEILGETYEPGKPADPSLGKWRNKLTSREQMLKYLENGERYWYGEEWFGSEKRKTPA